MVWNITSNGNTPLYALIDVLHQYPNNLELVSLLEITLPEMNPEAWCYPRENYQVTPLMALLYIITDNPSNSRLIHLAQQVAEKLPFASWLTITKDNKTPFMQLISIVSKNPDNDDLSTLAQKVLNREDASIVTELPPFAIHLISKQLFQSPKNEQMILIAKQVMKHAGPLIWSPKDPLGDAIQASILLEQIEALKNNPTNQNLIDMLMEAVSKANNKAWSVTMGKESRNPLSDLLFVLKTNPHNEKIINIVQAAGPLIWNRTRKEYDPVRDILLCLTKNPEHTTLIALTKTAIATLKSEDWSRSSKKEKPLKELFIGGLSLKNLIHFPQTLDELDALAFTLEDLLSLNSKLFCSLCSEALQALKQNQQDNGYLSFLEVYSKEMNIWSRPIEWSDQSKRSEKLASKSLLEHLLYLLENPTTQVASKLRVIKLLHNSAHEKSIDSWSSLEGNESAHLKQLKRILDNGAPELKEPLNNLYTDIQNKLPQESKKSSKKKPTIVTPQKKSLWDLIEAMLKNPTPNNCTHVLNYQPLEHWGQIKEFNEQGINNTWTPWMLFIICTLDNNVVYGEEQISQLMGVMNHLVDKLPKTAWTTPLLYEQKVIDYPWHSLLDILNKLSQKPAEESKQGGKIRALTSKGLKQIIEKAVKHLHTKHPEILDLSLEYHGVALNGVDLLELQFPEIKKSNSPVIKKLFSEESMPETSKAGANPNALFTKIDKRDQPEQHTQGARPN